MDDSAIICDEIIDVDVEAMSTNEAEASNKETKTIPTNSNEKKATCKT